MSQTPLQANLTPGDHKIFYIHKVSKYFDGLLGYPYLQQAKATIDTHNNLLILPGRTFQLKNDSHKNSQKTCVHISANEVKLCNVKACSPDGDFLVENDKVIANNIYVLGGLYRVENNTCALLVANDNDFPVTLESRQIKPELNNFSILKTDFQNRNKNSSRDILSKIRADHLNSLEKDELFKVILKHRNAFHKEGSKLTFTNIEKHKAEQLQ